MRRSARVKRDTLFRCRAGRKCPARWQKRFCKTYLLTSAKLVVPAFALLRWVKSNAEGDVASSRHHRLAVGTPVVGGLFDVVSTALCAGIEDDQRSMR